MSHPRKPKRRKGTPPDPLRTLIAKKKKARRELLSGLRALAKGS